tara:strand:+ start:291 stop:509 length:219 start_codon:yes stop_codon:yes gene_type:complete
MGAHEYYKKSEYSKIDFGSNPKLFSEKELIDFAEEYHKYRVVEQNKYLIENFAKQARPYQPIKENNKNTNRQ